MEESLRSDPAHSNHSGLWPSRVWPHVDLLCLAYRLGFELQKGTDSTSASVNPRDCITLAATDARFYNDQNIGLTVSNKIPDYTSKEFVFYPLAIPYYNGHNKILNKRKKEPELTERQASEGWVISPFSFISYKVIKHTFLIQTQRFQLGQGTGLDSSSLRGFHNLRNGALYRDKPPMSSFVWEFVWWFISRANTMYWGHIQGNGRRGGQWINKRVVVASGAVAKSAWLWLWSTLVVIFFSVGLLVASFIGAACAWLGGVT